MSRGDGQLIPYILYIALSVCIFIPTLLEVSLTVVSNFFKVD